MANTTHRISSNTLLREYTENYSQKFWDLGFQYVYANENFWDNAVWASGEYAKHRNKSYTNTGLIPMPPLDNAVEMQSRRIDLMLKQGFRFSPEGTIALHCILLDLNSNKILLSQYLTEDDFVTTSERLLIDGSFWMTSTTLYIPRASGIICAAITEITADDVDNQTGLIYNFTAPTEPLTDKKEMLETIQAKAYFDDNFYLNLELYNVENKTIQQALIDYLNYEPQTITVDYVVNYGNQTVGYKEIKISNEINNFASLKVGLDFSDYTLEEAENIEVQITVNIRYDNSLMSRELSLVTNMTTLINPIIERVLKQTLPESSYPVDVTIVNKIEQTVVETNTEREVIQVLQPVFCELLTNWLVIENKKVVFENLKQTAYLVIAKTKKTDEQILKNDITVDGVYYFDLSKLTPVSQDTTYTLYDETQSTIIGRGDVYVEYHVDQSQMVTDIP